MTAPASDIVNIGIIGCAGRMGSEIIASISRHKRAAYAGGTERNNVTDKALQPVFDAAEPLCERCDVVIDFSAPENVFRTLDAAANTGTPVVCGVTGFTDTQKKTLEDYAARVPLLYSANMSLGVNLLRALTRHAAALLDDSFDIDILEMHHKHKADAPSGTALALGEEAARGRNVALADVACYAREGVTGARPVGEIGFATLRGGSVPGDHSVIFAGENEHIILSHSAKNRGIFADGAVVAAVFMHNKANGLYGMNDALGLVI